jgi:hypothetical protein
MFGKKNNGRPPAPDSIFAARDARPAARDMRRAARHGATTERQRVESALTDAAFAQLTVVDEKPGFDPYNSGSFDRKHAWARTHRR